MGKLKKVTKKNPKKKRGKTGSHLRTLSGVPSPVRSKGTPFRVEQECEIDALGFGFNGNAWEFSPTKQRETENSNR